MRPLHGLRPVLFFLFFSLLSSSVLHGQADHTASKSLSISAFTGVSIVKTDREGTTNPGFTFAGDVGYYIHGFIPSIEARMKFAPGTFGQKTYGGGLRLQHRLLRAQLYGDFLWSYGTISEPYNGTTVHDNSIVYSPGGGFDYLINDALAARFDYQYEYWHTGVGVSFNPQAFTFGVVYRFPMKPYISR